MQPPAIHQPPALTRLWRSAIKSIGWGGGSAHGGNYTPPLYHYSSGPSVPGAEFDYNLVAGELRDNTVVAICNAWYAVNFPTARPQVGRVDPETGEFAPLGSEGKTERSQRQARRNASSHPAVRLLTTRPNPFFTWRQVWAATIEDYNVDGNAIWLKAGGDPYEIYWLPRCRVFVQPGKDVPVEFYRHHAWNGKVRYYRPDQIVHFRDGIDPYYPHLGISRLRKAIRSIATLNTGETYAAATARNGHSGVLITPKGGDIGTPFGGTPEEAELRTVTDRINHGLTGENSGKAEWATSPMDVNRIGFGPEQMRVDSILNRPETNVASIMGLNTMVLGLPSSAGTRSYANYAEADRQAWRNGVIPRQDIFAEFVTDGLLAPDFDDSLVMAWDRSFVDALSEDADAKVDRAIKLRAPDGSGKPLVSYNEARDLVDYPPVDGGDLTGIEEAEAEIERDREAQETARMIAESNGDPDEPDPDDDEPVPPQLARNQPDDDDESEAE